MRRGGDHNGLCGGSEALQVMDEDPVSSMIGAFRQQTYATNEHQTHQQYIYVRATLRQQQQSQESGSWAEVRVWHQAWVTERRSARHQESTLKASLLGLHPNASGEGGGTCVILGQSHNLLQQQGPTASAISRWAQVPEMDIRRSLPHTRQESTLANRE